MTDILSTCCFTGHRPEKLHEPANVVIPLLKREISNAVNRGYNTFISGMAAGVDLWASEIVLSLNQKLIAALPYDGYCVKDSEFRQLYKKILARSNVIITCSANYSPKAYSFRDRWMVDNSSLVIAVYHGESGGTEQTVKYAQTQNKNIIFCR